MHRLCMIAIWAFPAFADVCAPTDIQGSFGFQLSGISTIAEKPGPVATIGRAVFDADGNVNGYSSVNFNGLFLGNPVTGTYEFKTDCSLLFRLQDTSGGWQNFAGRVTPGGGRVAFSQSDPGTGGRGTMRRTAVACTNAGFTGIYSVTMSALTTPLARDRVDDATVRNARVEADGNGGLAFAWPRGTSSGTYKVDGECFVEIEFAPPGADPVKMRGVLLDGGAEVLAITTDPQAVGTARFGR